MLARLAARLLLAPLGFVLGLSAGFAMLALVFSGDLGKTPMLPEDVMLLGYDLSVSAVTIALLLAPLMAAPAMVAVLISEMFSIRSWVFHATAGALSAVLPWSVAGVGFEGPLFTASQVLAAGVVGGLVHWLVAGRSAGLADPAPPAGSGPDAQ